MTGDEHNLTSAEQAAEDAIQEAWCAGANKARHVYRYHARDLVAKLRPLLAAEAAPDIVVGEQARNVPDGSLLIKCTTDGVPYVDCFAFKMGSIARGGADMTASTQSFRILYRPPAPAPKVGDVVTTEAELNRLPLGAAVRDADGDLREHRASGWPGIASDDEVALPATVLDLGSAAA